MVWLHLSTLHPHSRLFCQRPLWDVNNGEFPREEIREQSHIRIECVGCLLHEEVITGEKSSVEQISGDLRPVEPKHPGPKTPTLSSSLVGELKLPKIALKCNQTIKIPKRM